MQVLYQSVHLDFSSDFARKASKGRLLASTSLWIALPLDTTEVYLHARQLNVEEVTVNNVSTCHRLVDPLERLVLETEEERFSGRHVDALLRASLEVSRQGELQIDIPSELSADYGVGVDALPEISDRRQSLRAFVANIQRRITEVNGTKSSDASLAKEENVVVGEELKEERFPVRVAQIKIKYTLPLNECTIGLGVRPSIGEVFSLSGSDLLFDVDGVRCWLPCLDCPNRGRACFDITLRTSQASDIIASGKCIRTEIISTAVKSTRFVTECAIPPFALGFFVGSAEKYTYPLYKTRGAIWVRKASKVNVPSSSSVPSSLQGGLLIAAVVTDAEEGSDEAEEAEQRHHHSVRHTTLGLDLASRKLHKFIGRLLASTSYTEIFIHDLGRDFLAFHGLVFIDAHFLHTSEQVYMETPVHILQVTAYLTAWLKVAIPIDDFDSTFLIHGIIGYSINCYVDHVFGEEYGCYRFQKMYDLVLSFDKMGRAFPLSCSFPELHESFTPCFLEYSKTKAAILFHIIENKIGDRDLLRTAIMELVHSPLLVVNTANHSTDKLELQPRASSSSRPRSQSLDSDSYTSHPLDTPLAQDTPFQCNSTPFAGNSTPFLGGSTPFLNESLTERSETLLKDKDNFPIPRPIERSNVEGSKQNVFTPLLADTNVSKTISGSDFIASIRQRGGMASTIEENFVDKYVRGTGISVFYISTRESREDAKITNLSVDLEQAVIADGAMGHPLKSVLNAVQVRVLDKNGEVGEGMVSFRNPKESFLHRIHVKRTYGPHNKKKGIEGAETLTMDELKAKKRNSLSIAQAESK